jgi:hypothetical protein
MTVRPGFSPLPMIPGISCFPTSSPTLRAIAFTRSNPAFPAIGTWAIGFDGLGLGEREMIYSGGFPESCALGKSWPIPLPALLHREYAFLEVKAPLIQGEQTGASLLGYEVMTTCVDVEADAGAGPTARAIGAVFFGLEIDGKEL